jgi:hypothetical protein
LLITAPGLNFWRLLAFFTLFLAVLKADDQCEKLVRLEVPMKNQSVLALTAVS